MGMQANMRGWKRFEKDLKKVTVYSQTMQQNITLVRHNDCEVIAWQRF